VATPAALHLLKGRIALENPTMSNKEVQECETLMKLKFERQESGSTSAKTAASTNNLGSTVLEYEVRQAHVDITERANLDAHNTMFTGEYVAGFIHRAENTVTQNSWYTERMKVDCANLSPKAIRILQAMQSPLGDDIRRTMVRKLQENRSTVGDIDEICRKLGDEKEKAAGSGVHGLFVQAMTSTSLLPIYGDTGAEDEKAGIIMLAAIAASASLGGLNMMANIDKFRDYGNAIMGGPDYIK
jgi:hypothetical protein